MTTICGAVRCNSRGAASSNLAIQIPLIAQDFPEIADVHHGTINLHLDRMLLVLTSDYRSKGISWGKPNDPEVFDFLRIKLEAPEGAAAINAWIYIAHGSPHRMTPGVHEIIAPKLQIADGDR